MKRFCFTLVSILFSSSSNSSFTKFHLLIWQWNIMLKFLVKAKVCNVASRTIILVTHSKDHVYLVSGVCVVYNAIIVIFRFIFKIKNWKHSTQNKTAEKSLMHKTFFFLFICSLCEPVSNMPKNNHNFILFDYFMIFCTCVCVFCDFLQIK